MWCISVFLMRHCRVRWILWRWRPGSETCRNFIPYVRFLARLLGSVVTGEYDVYLCGTYQCTWFNICICDWITSTQPFWFQQARHVPFIITNLNSCCLCLWPVVRGRLIIYQFVGWLFQSVCAVGCRVNIIQCAKLTCLYESVTVYKSPPNINSNKYSFGLHTAVVQTQTPIHMFGTSTMNMKVCCVCAAIDRMSRGHWYDYRRGEGHRVPQADTIPKRMVVRCMFHILALRNIYTSVVNQQTHTAKICFNIY